MPISQTHRELSVTSGAGADVLLVQRIRGAEELGRLFEYRVELVSTSGDVAIADVLGKPMAVSIALPAGGTRVYHGIVTRFGCTGRDATLTHYEAVLRPWLWLLTRASNCRIFQDKTVVEIVKHVCESGGYGDVALDVAALSGEYAALPYCVQYRETDFNFVTRLLEENGIYYFFRHEAGRHTMVLADSYGAHAETAGYETLKFRGEEGRGIVDQEAVQRWEAAGEIQPGAYALNDFDFEKASASLLAKSVIAPPFHATDFEMYDYPGGYTVAATGTARARGRLEGLQGQGEQIHGTTNARGVTTGALFALADHPRADENRAVLVTGTTLDVTELSFSSDAGPGFTYRATFTAIGKQHGYRPLPSAFKPVVQGPQTALVVGKSGEEIWTDKYGRIKVQFHWDRDGKNDELSSCWVRVQQAWAGKNWGTMFIPRIGMEVVVSFLEGDPDRPLVTGCVYNSDSLPPYELPANQTRSTVKTNTSKGGGGFNEIRFEDKKDSEEIFVQAEKDFNRVVKNNDTLKVGFEKKDKGDQTIQIKNDQALEVGNDQKITVTHDRTVKVSHDDSETVENNQTIAITKDQKIDVGGKQTVTITGDQSVTGQAKIEISATTSIELKVGSSSIKIEPAKITIKSAEIALEAQLKLSAQAPEVAVDGQAKVAVASGGLLELKAGGPASLQGAIVKIN